MLIYIRKLKDVLTFYSDILILNFYFLKRHIQKWGRYLQNNFIKKIVGMKKKSNIRS